MRAITDFTLKCLYISFWLPFVVAGVFLVALTLTGILSSITPGWKAEEPTVQQYVEPTPSISPEPEVRRAVRVEHEPEVRRAVRVERGLNGAILPLPPTNLNEGM